MTTSNYTLKVNRELLDPNFESYRLSLDVIPTYNVELDAGKLEVSLKFAQGTHCTQLCHFAQKKSFITTRYSYCDYLS